ncbi:unnamed protein product [Darwinula stevensoni]|uniref:EGF-like domain-containing protein n=1 Tax=Darwinula stevensoni TaxID=69355 RepID=A0A7R9AB29_9CRUS|nr:unnamed protein product [Darwinula stevensoni]CAG0898556.1 unnamed protein product [Darwinula stevensoni]
MERRTVSVKVDTCCSGYSESREECKPVCHPACINGFCEKPNSCKCGAGFEGKICESGEKTMKAFRHRIKRSRCGATREICDLNHGSLLSQIACRAGKWGDGCKNECNCKNEAKCDPWSGGCSCNIGWIGKYCETPCGAGMYGIKCQQTCRCKNSATCDHVTGKCTCAAGWTGPVCDEPCPKDTHGMRCASACLCKNDAKCDHISGKCTCSPGWTGSINLCPKCEMTCSFSCLVAPYLARKVHLGSDVHIVAFAKMRRNATMSVGIALVLLAGPDQCNCESPCPTGSYGVSCASACHCKNDAICDHISGKCTCSPGWHGSTRSFSCLVAPSLARKEHLARDARLVASAKMGRNATMSLEIALVLQAGPDQCKSFSFHDSGGDTNISAVSVQMGHPFLFCFFFWIVAKSPVQRVPMECNVHLHVLARTMRNVTTSPGNALVLLVGLDPCELHLSNLPDSNLCAKCEMSCSFSCLVAPSFARKEHLARDARLVAFAKMRRNATMSMGIALVLLAGPDQCNCESPCPTGSYGVSCASACPCKNDAKCDHISGKCTCSPGWHGSTCAEPCLEGTFGEGCSSRCLCQNGAKCNHVTGNCTCAAGWTGPICEDRCPIGTYGEFCAYSCACENDGVCNHISGNCSCTTGWIGEFCEEPCPNGHWGLQCRNECTCLNEGICSPLNGSCHCSPGYRGEQCELKCPSGRYGEDCHGVCLCENEGTCSHIDGTCICKDGWTGQYCNQRSCPDHLYGLNCSNACDCVLDNTEMCHPWSGECLCLPGWDGPICATPCPSNSFGKNCEFVCECKNNASCNHVDGSCVCNPGYMGSLCEDECPRGKFGQDCAQTCQCENDALCLHEDGKCLCQPGREIVALISFFFNNIPSWQGQHCDTKCPLDSYGLNCEEECSCYNEASCDHITGACTCAPGFNGLRCEDTCELMRFGFNCSHVCECEPDTTEVCDPRAGFCHCKQGAYGVRCEHRCGNGLAGDICNDRCKCGNNSSCHLLTMKCVCDNGWTGHSCDEPCPPGFHGPDCKERCPECHHAIGTCHHVTGHCKCEPGYNGQTCNETCPIEQFGNECQENCTCENHSGCHHITGRSCLHAPSHKYPEETASVCLDGEVRCARNLASKELLAYTVLKIAPVRTALNAMLPMASASASPDGWVLSARQFVPRDSSESCAPWNANVPNRTFSVITQQAAYAKRDSQVCFKAEIRKPRSFLFSSSNFIPYPGNDCETPIALESLSFFSSNGPGLIAAISVTVLVLIGVAVYIAQRQRRMKYKAKRVQIPVAPSPDVCPKIELIDCKTKKEADHANTKLNSKIGGENDEYFLPQIPNTETDLFDEVCQRIPEVLDWSCLMTNQYVLSFMFITSWSSWKEAIETKWNFSLSGIVKMEERVTQSQEIVPARKVGWATIVENHARVTAGDLNATIIATVRMTVFAIHQMAAARVLLDLEENRFYCCKMQCRPGSYGEDCDVECLCENGGTCSPIDGNCTCNDGWTGQYCNERSCSNHLYGLNCSTICDCVFDNTEMCHPWTGECLCLPGWNGTTCATACPTYSFGKNCEFVCECNNNASCNHVDGTCVCIPGKFANLHHLPRSLYFWMNGLRSLLSKSPPLMPWLHRVFRVSKFGKFGLNCTYTCEYENDDIFLHDNRQCICKPVLKSLSSFIPKFRWEGQHCNITCPLGSYGLNCMENCSCYNDATCDHTTGACTCASGFKGPRCEDTCELMSFGVNCSQACECVPDSTEVCDPKTGFCSCKPDYYGDVLILFRVRCEHQCENGQAGDPCNDRCKCGNNSSCHPQTEKCVCDSGWTGKSCDEPCPSGSYGGDCKETCLDCSHGRRSLLNGRNSEHYYFTMLTENTFFFKKIEFLIVLTVLLWSWNYFSELRMKLILLHYSAIEACHHVTGRCTCQPGYIGRTCDEVCPIGQFGNDCQQNCTCENHSGCSHINGPSYLHLPTLKYISSDCLCLPGWRGDMCEKPCLEGTFGLRCLQNCTCRNGGKCNATDGRCKCLPGWVGRHCEAVCSDGYFGDECTQQCQCPNKNFYCNHTVGCTCKEGYAGKDCEKPFTLELLAHSSFSSDGFIAFVSVIFLLVLIILTLMVFIARRIHHREISRFKTPTSPSPELKASRTGLEEVDLTEPVPNSNIELMNPEVSPARISDTESLRYAHRNGSSPIIQGCRKSCRRCQTHDFFGLIIVV